MRQMGDGQPAVIRTKGEEKVTGRFARALPISLLLVAQGASGESPADPRNAPEGATGEIKAALDVVDVEKRAALDRLAWLAGCWERRKGDRISEEQWMAPRGATMVGMSRTVAGKETRAWEFLRIEEREGRLVYIATPSGQTEAAFEQIALSDSAVTFANPAHDYPQRVGYRLLPDGSALARIEGEIKGAERVVDFPLNRVSCDQRTKR